jgi:hypothetical protein
MRYLIVISTFWLFILSSCNKTLDVAPANMNMTDYYPLQVGKFITYKLDSTVFTNLGTQREVRTYVVQDLIDAVFNDNLGQQTWRIRRKIRSLIDTTQWLDNASFLVTPGNQRMEFTENNLRFIKLVNPVSPFISWKGNSHINVIDDFLRFYENWDYTYEKLSEPLTVNGITYPETITVNHIDQTDGNPNDKRFFYEVTRSSEVYAKGIGLIYKDFLHEFWQPNSANFQNNSFGVRLTILSHNF